MNILLLTTHLNPGGITSYVISLAKGLKESGHNVLVVSSGGRCVELLIKEGIAHISIPIRTKSELSPKALVSFFRLKRIIRDCKIQVIHSQTRVTQVLGFLLSKFTGIIFVATCHGFYKPRLFRKIFPCWGNRVIAISNEVRKHLINDFKVDEQKISLIYNGVDISNFQVIKEQSLKSQIKKRFGLDNKVVIGIVARLVPIKGHKFLLLAFKEVIKVISNARLFIVGDGPDKDNSLSLVKKLGLIDHVVFHPSVEYTSDVLGAMDLFCLPSLKEGFGIAVLEAQACGVPIIASSVGGIKEIIEHNKTGILIPPADSNAIKEAVINLINDAHLRNSLVENALKLVKEKFSSEEMVAKTLAVYNAVNLKRILIVEVNWLGDVLFSTAAIRIIRKNFPESFIACMIVPRVKEILEGNPSIDKLIIFDEEGKHRGLLGKLSFISILRKENFDTVFLFHRSFTRLLLCFLAGIKTRIGYYRRKTGFLLTHKIVPADITSMHRGMYYAEILKKAGLIMEEPLKAEFFISQDARGYIKDLLKNNDIGDNDKFVVLNAGANWLPKRWPAGYFAELAKRLIKELNMKVVFSGSAKDLDLVNEVFNKIEGIKPINLSGKTNLKQLAALFERASVVVSADSGPMHIADCVGAKVISLFGPTSTKMTAPLKSGYINVVKKDAGCLIPCYEKNCPDNRCMKAISVEEVFNKVKSLL